METKDTKLVHILWKDSHTMGGTDDMDEHMEWAVKSDLNMESVGFLTYECEEFVVIVQSYSSTSVNNAIKIPQSAITLMKEL